MGKLVLLLYLAPWLMVATCMDMINDTDPLANISDPNKDMYVIHAMVYQVGILTNKTDNETDNFNATGHQEALTFYHTNGTQVDLSQIPEPLLTNVNAQSLVGVAPVPGSVDNPASKLPWSTLNHLTNIGSQLNPEVDPEQPKVYKSIRDMHSNQNIVDRTERSFDNLYQRLFKRETSDDTPVAISKGAAVIPEGAGVHSIAIPPLLTLNNNLSQIPVPIPNTSIVHYAKINTLLTQP